MVNNSEDAKKYRHDYYMNQYATRVKNGLCVRCGKPLGEDKHKYCFDCRLYLAKKRAESRKYLTEKDT